MISAKYDNILDALARSKFRARFSLNDNDRDYIENKGLDTIRQHAFEIIMARIAPAFPKNDGKQTPMRGHPVFIAQHATATCCRGCIEKWHRIAKGRRLNQKEIDFLVELIMAWIEKMIKPK